MRLNHMDLQVSDVTRAREFFETFFELRCVYQRAEQIALLEDETGFSLAVSNLFGSPAPAYPADFHVGFVLERESDVRAHYERLQEAGVPMKRELGRGGPNVYFTCLGPDSIPVEVSAPRDEA
ncbi:MAG TPA: VOC family protein [Longimicrobiales bacterium]|nr:VOC family protein [Longimicrobiales bacterium]